MYDKNPPENGGFVSNLSRIFIKNTASQKACRDVVEMGGIEPPSEEASPQGTTSVVCD